MKTHSETGRWKVDKRSVADRVRRVRERIYGVDGASRVAVLVGVPERTWTNYESGVTIPAEVILQFMALTGVEPAWLLGGMGPIFREGKVGLPGSEDDREIHLGRPPGL